jgi:hypothetical protein
MDFEQILEKYLLNDDMRQELFLRLRREGGHSEAGRSFVNCITSLRMHIMPKALENKNIVQKISTYLEPQQCFLNFRLISRLWRDAIRSCRVDISPTEELFEFPANYTQPIIEGKLNFIRKYLGICREIKFSLSQNFLSNWGTFSPMIYEHTHNLTKLSINFPAPDINFNNSLIDLQPFNDFIIQILQKK